MATLSPTESVLGNYRVIPAAEVELALSLPQAMAPWDAANRVAVFLHAWLEQPLRERALNLDDLNFVVNELMENAVKYSSAGNIELCVCFEERGIRFSVRNESSIGRARRYFGMANDLLTRDPDELFAEIIEQNAETSSSNRVGAGLGLLSMRQNYQAQLGFHFSGLGEARSLLSDDSAQIQTQVCLPWPDLAASVNIAQANPPCHI